MMMYQPVLFLGLRGESALKVYSSIDTHNELMRCQESSDCSNSWVSRRAPVRLDRRNSSPPTVSRWSWNLCGLNVRLTGLFSRHLSDLCRVGKTVKQKLCNVVPYRPLKFYSITFKSVVIVNGLKLIRLFCPHFRGSVAFVASCSDSK